MDAVQNTTTLSTNNNINVTKLDNMNNDMTIDDSTSGYHNRYQPRHSGASESQIYKVRNSTPRSKYTDPSSDNEIFAQNKNKRHSSVHSHHKSMGNINEAYEIEYNLAKIQNSISNVDLSLHRSEIKKFETLQVPIVGYEVMEERARFTIYKLKVEDDKRDQSWLVFRRYTDFVRLYSRIKAEQPNLMLPLPGKRWFKDNFEPSFLEERVRGLQTFVNAILAKLPDHPVVREFFCLDEPPQVFSYQPEVQAVYGALEDSISSLKVQLKQKDATIAHLHNRLAKLESQVQSCAVCSAKGN